MRQVLLEERGSSVWTTSGLVAGSGVGCGLLTLPHAVSMCGPRAGAGLLVAGAALSALSTGCLLVGAKRLECQTYGELIDKCLGYSPRVGPLPLVDSITAVYLVACNVGKLVFLGDFARDAAAAFGVDAPAEHTVPLFMLLAAALLLRNEMRGVAKVAAGGLLATLLTCGVVLWKAPALGHAVRAPAPEPTLVGGLRASGTMAFAYGAATSMPPIGAEMRRAKDALPAAAAGTLVVCAFFCSISLACFFSFHQVQADFTEAYGDDPLMTVCRVLLIPTLLANVVLSLLPALKSAYCALGTPEPTRRTRGVCVAAVSVVSVLCALATKDVSRLTSWLGALFGGPELLLAPTLLLGYGHVGSLSRAKKYALFASSGALNLYLWVAALVDLHARSLAWL